MIKSQRLNLCWISWWYHLILRHVYEGAWLCSCLWVVDGEFQMWWLVKQSSTELRSPLMLTYISSFPVWSGQLCLCAPCLITLACLSSMHRSLCMLNILPLINIILNDRPEFSSDDYSHPTLWMRHLALCILCQIGLCHTWSLLR